MRHSETQAGAPRLVQRFAAFTAVAFLLVVVAVVIYVRQTATVRATQSAKAHASFVADTILRSQLTPSDFAAPAGSVRRAELDRLFSREVLVGEAVRVKLYRIDGTVIYATDHSQIGKRDLSHEVTGALGGVTASEIGSLNGEGGAGPDEKALEAYVPMRFADGEDPTGAFEVYQRYAPVAQAAREEYVPVATVLGLGLLALFISTVPGAPARDAPTRRSRGRDPAPVSARQPHRPPEPGALP